MGEKKRFNEGKVKASLWYKWRFINSSSSGSNSEKKDLWAEFIILSKKKDLKTKNNLGRGIGFGTKMDFETKMNLGQKWILRQKWIWDKIMDLRENWIWDKYNFRKKWILDKNKFRIKFFLKTCSFLYKNWWIGQKNNPAKILTQNLGLRKRQKKIQEISRKMR